MSSPLRDITIVDSEDSRNNVSNLVGVDESEDSDSFVVVAVRCARSDDISLVRALIESELQPFEHKSSTIVRYGDLDQQERAERVKTLLEKLDESSITWGAVTCQTNPTNEIKAAATTMAVKKSITTGLKTGDLAHGCGGTAMLHDGQYDSYSDHYVKLREFASGHFDTGFQRSICPVYLTFLRKADRTYPQNNAADYVAGFLRDQVRNGAQGELPNHVYSFDKSWIDSAPQPDPIYHLDEFDPVQEAELHSRVIAWMTGRGLPKEPSPRRRDPYFDLVNQIEDPTVRKYLSEEI